MTTPTHNPATLPDTDTIEVVLLNDDYDPAHVTAAIPGRTLARLTGEPAQRAARLWRALPSAEQMRCHMPRYALRFYATGVLLLEAALCFECNNISILRKGRREWATFDGQASPAQELLALLRSHDPSQKSL